MKDPESCNMQKEDMDMNMKEIEVLSKLANYQTFSDAAFGLSYSPSVISKYVLKVEEELGVKLFIRGNRSNELSMTIEGRVLMRDIQRLNADYQRMLEMVKQLRGTLDKTLHVGSQARLANNVEQEILALFMLQNSNIDIEQVKMNARDLIRLLQSGKLDATFVSIPANSEIEDFLIRDTSEYADMEISLLNVEKDVYLGISNKYLPNVKEEASFASFKDFSFAFAFPSSMDEQEAKAIEPFQALASKHGFQLKAAYFGAHDSTILKLARMAPVAVTATNIPAQYEGIKFIRVSDWTACAKLLFICMKNNNKKALLYLKKSVAQYQKQNQSLTF